MSDAIDTLPIELVVRGRRAIVIGASGECVSKVERLALAGADVRVFPEGEPIDPKVAALASAGEVSIEQRAFDVRDAEGAAVIFVSPSMEALGAELAAEARTRGTLVSTLDRPESCTFINPAVARGAGLRVAISSGGAAPALVRALRVELERVLDDPKLARFVAELGARRAALPRGARGAAMNALLEGFEAHLRVVFPAWFEGRDHDARG